MLPSRGFLRASQSSGLGQATFLSRSSTRQFGTALRTFPSQTPLTARSPTARRLAGPLALAAFSSRQARFASTQPAPSAPITPPPPTAEPDFSTTLSDLLGSDHVLEIPEQIGFLKGLGLDYGWGPTSCMQWLVEHIYIYTGLPWWATLAVTAVGIRLAIFKPTIGSQIESQKMQDLRKNPKYSALQDKMKAAAQMGDQDGLRAVRIEMRNIHRAIGLKWWKVAIPMVNLPIGYGMLRLFRGMADLPVPSLETGGLLWFQNLAVADPYYILPLAAAGLFVLSMRVPIPYMAAEQQKTMRAMGVVLVPISVLATMWMPAGLQFFFLISGGLQYLQAKVFYHPMLRHLLGLGYLHLGGEAARPTASNYQAPRTMDTTATVVPPKDDGMLDSFKGSFTAAKDKLRDYQLNQEKKNAGRSKVDYEQKAELDQQARALKRAERRRAMRQDRRE
ncbi:60Kd inner membrane protein-domain-containing protein [Podospora conica]|nr:60Kd inner membrane protein-domain-containing protein [Schizothecium conicum]